MTRSTLDTSGWQSAAATRPNGATASVDAGCNRAIPHRGRSFA